MICPKRLLEELIDYFMIRGFTPKQSVEKAQKLIARATV